MPSDARKSVRLIELVDAVEPDRHYRRIKDLTEEKFKLAEDILLKRPDDPAIMPLHFQREAIDQQLQTLRGERERDLPAEGAEPSPALELLREQNLTLAAMVEAGGDKADLRLPWGSLPEKLRGRMVEALHVPTRVATYPEVERACRERELFKPGGFSMLKRAAIKGAVETRAGEAYLMGGISGACVVAFVVDASKTTKQIADEIERVLSVSMLPPPPEGAGRGGNSGNSTFGKALDALQILRLASRRMNDEVERIKGSGATSGGIRLRKMEAERFFTKIFPMLAWGRTAKESEASGMISGRCYATRPRGKRVRQPR